VQTGLAGPQESDLKITLSVHNYAPIESETLIRVEQEVTRIYRKIGVKTVDIVLIIVAHPMTELGAQSDSLGLTPGAGSKRDLAYVFHDRVEALYRKQIVAAAQRKVQRWATTAQILGYAMAHEIGHLLGLSHSPIGIMREGWRWTDLLAAAYGSLNFTLQQASAIRME